MATNKLKIEHPKTTKKCCSFTVDRMESTKDGARTVTDTCTRCRQRDVVKHAAKETDK